MKRLDRVLINVEFWDFSTSISVSHLVQDPSDHAPLLISLSSRIDNKPRPFWFLNMWLSKDGLLEVIRGVWQGDVVGSTFYAI